MSLSNPSRAVRSRFQEISHNPGQGSSLSWSKCITNGTREIFTKRTKTMMVQNNQKDRQSSSKFINEKAQKSLNLQRGLMKLGHPADCNSKKGNSSGKKKKKGIAKSRKRSYKPSAEKGNDCLFKISHQHLNHYWNIKARTQNKV